MKNAHKKALVALLILLFPISFIILTWGNIENVLTFLAKA
jgi:hypothetical protein